MHIAKSQIGQFNPLQQEVTPPICDQITDGIKEVQPDAVYNSHFYILTEKNEVIVIEMKNSDNTCRFKQKLNQLTIKSENGQQGQESGLLTIKNSLMVWNNKHNVLKVYNTTDIQQEQTELYEPFEIDIHKQQSYIEDTSVAFKFQKLSSTSSYILIHEKNPLSSNVTIYEVIIPQKQETDFINNIRLPILIVAVIVFILYQYFKKDQEEAKTSFEDFNLKADKQSNESEKKDDDNKKPLKAIEQGSRDSQDSNNSNPSTMDSIQNKYSQINLEPTKKSTQQTNRRNYVSRMHDIDDIDYRKHLHY